MNFQTHRLERINFIYKVYLMNLSANKLVNELDLFIIDSDFTVEDIEMIKNIASNISKYEEMLKPYLPNGWSWERINLVERSILIASLSEIVDYKNKKAIVIDEAVKYSKKFAEKDSYKMINAILDNFKNPE